LALHSSWPLPAGASKYGRVKELCPYFIAQSACKSRARVCLGLERTPRVAFATQRTVLSHLSFLNTIALILWLAKGSMDLEALNDRIRELCAQAITTRDSEAQSTLAELQKNLQEHARLVRTMVAQALSHSPTEMAFSKSPLTRSGHAIESTGPDSDIADSHRAGEEP
jgi:hypothetical protein